MPGLTNLFDSQAVVPGPAEHPLQYNYTFWYSRRTPGRPTSSQSYEQNIKQIGTFASVSTWGFHVVTVVVHSCLYLHGCVYLRSWFPSLVDLSL